MDNTHTLPYWEQQVSGGFHYNDTATARPWSPAWTSKDWASATAVEPERLTRRGGPNSLDSFFHLALAWPPHVL